MMENRKTNNKPHRRRGFTAVEMMTVVAILGILLMVAMPNFSSYVHAGENNKRKANIDILISAIQRWSVDNEDTAKRPANFTSGTDQKNSQGRYVFHYISDKDLKSQIFDTTDNKTFTVKADSIYKFEDYILSVPIAGGTKEIKIDVRKLSAAP